MKISEIGIDRHSDCLLSYDEVLHNIHKLEDFLNKNERHKVFPPWWFGNPKPELISKEDWEAKVMKKLDAIVEFANGKRKNLTNQLVQDPFLKRPQVLNSCLSSFTVLYRVSQLGCCSSGGDYVTRESLDEMNWLRTNFKANTALDGIAIDDEIHVQMNSLRDDLAKSFPQYRFEYSVQKKIVEVENEMPVEFDRFLIIISDKS
jgi:hypothetical protein